MAGTLNFTEKLRGDLYQVRKGFRTALEPQRVAFTHMVLEMTVHINSLSRFARVSDFLVGLVEGMVRGDPFPREPARVAGDCRLIKLRFSRALHREYRIAFTSEGALYTLVGEAKTPSRHPLLGGSREFDHVAVEMFNQHCECVAVGVLSCNMMDLFELVRSMRVHPPQGESTVKSQFLRQFMGKKTHGILKPWGNLDLPERRRGLSLSHAKLKPRYDVVIIGSGYGGGTVAARLSQWRRPGERKSVCVIEKGRDWRAGDFPASTPDLLQALRSDSNPGGLIEYHVNREIDVVAGSGLGGTSLVNAGVMSRPNPLVFKMPSWPARLPDLAPYFDRAIESLNVARNPNSPVKSKVFSQAARMTDGLTATDLLDHAITFEKVERTEEGVQQHACIDCGECVTGCNYSAKNSVDMNYLPIAQAQGASIFSCIEVRSIERLDSGGFRLHCVDLDDGDCGRPISINASQVVLAAGVLSTFAILSRSRQMHDLRLSPVLGSCFSANCNVLGFSYNCRSRTLIQEGRTVTVMAKYWNSTNLEDQFIIEEGGIPGMLAPMSQILLPQLWGIVRSETGRASSPVSLRLRLRMLADLARSEKFGALNSSLMFLGTGFDDCGGRLVLERDIARICWPELGIRRYGNHIRRKMEQMAHYSGGTFLEDPRTLDALGANLHTVHPLGGCIMGEDETTGVVNYKGEVFGHEGLLHIVDASVIPSSLGVNPALTITALAEWFAECITEA